MSPGSDNSTGSGTDEQLIRAREIIAELRARVVRLESDIEDLIRRHEKDTKELTDKYEKSIKEINSRLDGYDQIQHRWKGGFALVVGLGMLIGWVASLIPNLTKIK